eukprot:14752050-Alexandrium_andersonii.AAC.1
MFHVLGSLPLQGATTLPDPSSKRLKRLLGDPAGGSPPERKRGKALETARNCCFLPYALLQAAAT